MDFDVQGLMNRTIGTMVWGVMISTLLFGCVTKQVFVYYQNYSKDRWQLRALVFFVWILELLHTCCIIQSNYFSTVTRHGHPDIWVLAPTATVATYLTCVIVTIIQAFYTLRLIKCYTKSYFAVICWVLMAFDFVVLIVYLIMDQKKNGQTPLIWSIVCITGFYVTGGVDLLISIFLCYYLFTNRHHSTYTSTINILNRLIIMTIITGFIMAFMSITVATLIVTSTNYSMWYMAVIFCDGKVYSNLMLLSLNTRAIHRETADLPITLPRIEVPQTLGPSGYTTPVKPQRTPDTSSVSQ